MKKVLIEVQYNGKNFSGWQIQNVKGKELRTVEGELKKILSSFLGEKISLFASGRTDAGVHAKSQFAHFETSSKMDLEKLPQALQNLLPDDISVTNSKIVPNNFNARYCVKEKTYHYMCYISKIRDVFLDQYAMQIKDDLDIKKMKKAIKYFVGEHDFTSFCLAKKAYEKNDFDFDLPQEIFKKKQTNFRTITNFKIEKKGNTITFKISGNGFLHNMVRIIVGTLIEIGERRRKCEEILDILNKKNRIYAGKTAPSNGLMLYSVKY